MPHITPERRIVAALNYAKPASESKLDDDNTIIFDRNEAHETLLCSNLPGMNSWIVLLRSIYSLLALKNGLYCHGVISKSFGRW